MRIYTGERGEYGAQGFVDGRLLDLRLDLRSHSPTGFEWGYPGSGPAQLALALCADVLHDGRRALLVYQHVKDVLIVPIHDNVWTLNEDTIRAAIEDAERRIAV